MKSFSLLLLVASISFITGAGLTYVAKTPWTSDMANQASIKPQEGPMLPPQGSVATDVIAGTAASSGNTSESEAGHQSAGHQHAMGGAAGHQHDGASAKHDHAAKGSSKAMGQQPGTSAAGGHEHDGASAKHDHAAKGSSKGMGQQPGTSAAGHQHGGAAAKHDHAAKESSKAMGHQHGTSAAGGHQQDGASAKHDHGAKGSSPAMAHQHGTSATGHQHGGAAAKDDQGSKSAAPSQSGDSLQKQAGKAQEPSATTSHPLPYDLLGSAGTGPGTTSGSGQSMGATSGDQRKDTSGNEQGSKTVPPAKMKDGHDNHSSNSPNAGAGGSHDQGTSASSGQKATKMAAHDQHSSKTMSPAKMKDGQDNHSSNPHSPAGGGGHEHGTSTSSGQKAIKMAAHDHGEKAGSSPGKAKHSHQRGITDKMKAAASPGMHQHGPGASAGDGHAHGDMHSQGQITNPIKPTEASVKKGQQLFNIYCSVCHGAEGRGGTPMESKIRTIPKFTPELLRSVDDNHMFTMVTSGHGPMPGYAEALTPEERWHITNYVRTLPDKLAAEKKATVRQGASR